MLTHPESYAQCLQDLMILNCFGGTIDPQKVTYLEIGVNHPIIWNNTYLFYKYGCRGVLIEPLSELIQLIKQNRPEDIVIEGAVGWTEEKTAILKRHGRRGAGSYLSDYKWKGYPSCLEVKLYKINDLIQNYFDPFPTFICIHTEGKDLNILQTLDFDKYKIPLICSETADKHNFRKAIDALLFSKKYYLKFMNNINSIYVLDYLMDDRRHKKLSPPIARRKIG